MDRIDSLLDACLDSGEIPADVTAAERAELEQLLAAAGVMRTARAEIDAEAVTARPVARARFERFLQQSRKPVAASTVPRESPRAFGLPRTVGLALAGLALIAVVAMAVNRAAFGGTETVNALEPGDYAEVQGVVTATEGEGEGEERLLRVETAIGVITVEAGDTTSVIDEEDAAGLDAVRPGVAVLVAGLVGEDRRIVARTLALNADGGETPVRAALRRFRAADVGLVGSVQSISLAPDGSRALVTIEGPGGRQFVVEVEEHTAARLLAAREALGLRVRVVEAEGGGFTLEPLDPAPAASSSPDDERTVPPGRPDGTGSGQPTPVAVEGVVLSADGSGLVVATRRGRVHVSLVEETRILPATSGLTVDEIRAGDRLVGHLVAVRGGLDGDGAVRADVLVAGETAGRGR